MRRPTNSHPNSLDEIIARKRRKEKRRSRKRVISSGKRANALNSLCLAGALLLCLAHFEHLQADADYKLIELDSFAASDLQQKLQALVRHGHWISAAMFLFHVVALKCSTTRFTFPCLLALFAWPINAFLHVEQNHHHDYLISRLALSAFLVLITTTIMFLPKKLKRRKRPNTFNSAFSIASTPISQQSSQLNTSQCSLGNRTIDFDDNATVYSDRSYRSANPANGLLFANSGMMAGMANNHHQFQQHPFGMNNGRFGGVSSPSSMIDTMSLRSGKTFATGTTKSGMFSNNNKPKKTPTIEWREKRRESTPMREVRELIDDLLINNSTETEGDSSSGDESSAASTARAAPSMWGNGEQSKCHNNGGNMLSVGAISPNRKRLPCKQGPFSSLTFNPAVFKRANAATSSVNSSPSINKFTKGSPPKSTYSYGGGSSCSSLSTVLTSSPFRKHL